MKYIWHSDKDFKHLHPITQVYGICFDKKANILILKESENAWNIPGGKPELNETPIQTLKRELREEVDVEIGDHQMIGYLKVLSDNPVFYQLRFACKIEEINKLTIDPSSGVINQRKFVKPSEFFDYVKIEDYREMIAEAIKWYKNNL
ncbi:MAG TPA: NUDIX hydrolase [bacterium]|nr:NUDIX hydrolase [bacterium]